MTLIEEWHGTINGYKRHKCRCDVCRSMYAKYQSEYRSANREKVAAGKRAYYMANRERMLAKQRAYREAKPDVIREWHAANRERVAAGVRQSKYRLSPRDFSGLIESQDGCCAICGQAFKNDTPHVDHDHSCCPGQKTCGKCVRGLLCASCNRGLGLFGDSPDRLRNAAIYLEQER